MKKAFTLIELLVVIAIIAILAAILFPVFAQAKTAAKKAVSISNQKQQGLALILYANDSDDLYPRQDACTLNDSINPALNALPAGTDPTPYCDGTNNYAFRDNHYSWFKWIVPYTKSTGIFFHPVIQKDPGNWNSSGEIFGGYALNLSLTGALNTWDHVSTDPDHIRNSFTGGTQTGISSPAEAWIIMELPNTTNPFVGTITDGVYRQTSVTTNYPKANRENWIPVFYKRIGTSGCNYDATQLDPAKVPFAGSVPLTYADGHTSAMPTGQFIANSPGATDYVNSFSGRCGLGSGSWSNGSAPTWTQPWPLWSLK